MSMHTVAESDYSSVTEQTSIQMPIAGYCKCCIDDLLELYCDNVTCMEDYSEVAQIVLSIYGS